MISFLQPLALLGLAAAAIPTLFHLLGRRLPPAVVFPAVRYLSATEREHSRRLRLRNLLLLILRTMVILLVVLAAARPVARIGSGAAHPPTAIAVVVDNSLSSGAVVEGDQVLRDVVDAAKQVLRKLNAGDRLWLVLADEMPRRVTPLEADVLLDAVRPLPFRMDVARAIRNAAHAVGNDALPGKSVVVFSDMQATAFSPGDSVSVRVLVWEPPRPPDNRWVDSVLVDPPVWSPSGVVTASVGGVREDRTALRLTVAGRDLARGVTSAGAQAVLSANAPGTGWWAAAVELDPDELRADDRHVFAIHAAPPVAARASPGAGRFVVEALQVLEEGGRIRSGGELTIGDRLSSGASVILPPADPALAGAVNRSLAARGISWQLGDVLDGEWQIGDVAGSEASVYRRHRLIGSGTVVLRVGGEPWLVRDGDVLLIASRMDPDWTQLPVTAGFVPFLDLVLNRVASKESWIVRGVPGGLIELPPSASRVLTASGSIAVPSEGRVTAPVEPGVYFLTDQAGDTVGAVELNHDRRESHLQPADEQLVRGALGSQVSLAGMGALQRSLFRGSQRADLSGLLLLAAVVLALVEFGLASMGGRAPGAE